MCDCTEERVDRFCKQFWPKNSTAASFFVVISTYTTLLSIIDQVSMREALKDADNQTTFTVNEEISDVTVSTISKSILWNCREYSVTRRFYRTFYLALIIILHLYIFIVMFKKPWRDSCKEPNTTVMETLEFLSDLFLRISLAFLLTSYDIDPWLCINGPSSITYTEDTQEVELMFPQSVLTYQRVAPVFTAIFGILGWILGMCVLEDKDKDKQKA